MVVECDGTRFWCFWKERADSVIRPWLVEWLRISGPGLFLNYS